MDFINTTTVYRHCEKGGLYKVLYIHKMKNPEDGEWIPCVTYQSIYDNRIWTRSLESFTVNFEDVNKLADKGEIDTSCRSGVGY